jgi:hypothetical protein
MIIEGSAPAEEDPYRAQIQISLTTAQRDYLRELVAAVAKRAPLPAPNPNLLRALRKKLAVEG